MKREIKTSCDILIVGGGPIGLTCAIEAKKRGFDHLIIEKGCLCNSIYMYPTYMTFFSTPDLLEIGGIPFVTEQNKPTRGEALEYYRRVKEFYELNMHTYEKVESITGESGGFLVQTSKRQYQAKKVILAIGFFDRPRFMNVPGEDLPKVSHYYRDPYPYAGQELLVVGSGNSAAINALECYRHGARVTVAIRGEGFHEGVKYWIKPDIENRIRDGDIRAYFNTEVVEIRSESVVLKNKLDRQTFEIDNDFVLAMTGYEPDFSFLETIGVQLKNDQYRTPVYNPETYETSRPGIYIAGVTVGGLLTNKWFIENSRAHAVAIVQHIAGQPECSADAFP
jgi:thioredoxin reductase (NADPH)